MCRISRFALLVCAGAIWAAPPDASLSQANAVMARLPLRFEENRGQAAPGARYLARGAGFSLEMTGRGPAFAIGARRIELTLDRSNAAPVIVPEDRMRATTNYLVGQRDRWHTAVANYGRIRYREVYRGIDAVYYGNQSRLE